MSSISKISVTLLYSQMSWPTVMTYVMKVAYNHSNISLKKVQGGRWLIATEPTSSHRSFSRPTLTQTHTADRDILVTNICYLLASNISNCFGKEEASGSALQQHELNLKSVRALIGIRVITIYYTTHTHTPQLCVYNVCSLDEGAISFYPDITKQFCFVCLVYSDQTSESILMKFGT